MNLQRHQKSGLWRSGFPLAALCLISALAASGQKQRSTLVITSTNSASGNAVVVFKLDTAGTPSLALAKSLPTDGKGGASTNAGILQFNDDLGAVANFGSNTVTQLVRYDNSIAISKTVHLAPDCVKPDSVALTREHLFVVGANCAESHAWPSGYVDGPVVSLTDPSAAQIAVGRNWAAVTMSAGSLLQLPLTQDDGVLNGTSTSIPLPSDADMVPLGAAFWGNVLGFTPAHSPDSFAIVDEEQNLTPIAGPTPVLSGQRPLLGGQRTGKYLVHGQLSRARNLYSSLRSWSRAHTCDGAASERAKASYQHLTIDQGSAAVSRSVVHQPGRV